MLHNEPASHFTAKKIRKILKCELAFFFVYLFSVLMMNLSEILAYHAGIQPDKIAYYFGDTSYRYSQVNAWSNRVANALTDSGIKPGDKIALTCPNIPYFPIIYYGILKTGAVVVPLSILLKRDEVACLLANSEAVAYFCFEGSEALPMGVEGYQGYLQAENCKDFIVITNDAASATPFGNGKTLHHFLNTAGTEFEAQPTNNDDTAVVIYTSGTTGKPKGAELSHANLAWNARVCQELFKMTNDDVALTVLPRGSKSLCHSQSRQNCYRRRTQSIYQGSPCGL